MAQNPTYAVNLKFEIKRPTNRFEKMQSIEIKDDILALNRTCQNIQIEPLRIKHSGKKCVDLLNPKLRRFNNRNRLPIMDKFIPQIIPIDEGPTEVKGPGRA